MNFPSSRLSGCLEILLAVGSLYCSAKVDLVHLRLRPYQRALREERAVHSVMRVPRTVTTCVGEEGEVYQECGPAMTSDAVLALDLGCPRCRPMVQKVFGPVHDDCDGHLK